MKIQYISDIHLEFYKPHKVAKRILKNINPNEDVKICILSGDIGYPFQPVYEEFLIFMNSKFEHVFLITGNHEYYQFGKNKGKTMKEINDKIQEIIEVNKLNNVHFLNNSTYDLIYEDNGIDNGGNGHDGNNNKTYRFIGTTLWSKLFLPQYMINDKINIAEHDFESCNKWHQDNVTFLKTEIDKCNLDDNKIIPIVITHHLPSYSLIDEKYKDTYRSYYNQSYASNCDDLMKNSNIKCWFYGHTHTGSVQTINDVICAANPIGYPDENKNIDFNKVIDLD
jgi:predicted phosphodiesterase